MDIKSNPTCQDCPTHNTPRFKECDHCHECAILKSWDKELQEHQKKSWWSQLIEKILGVF